MIQGLYQAKHAVPFVPGSDVAGFVQEVGCDVEHLAKGDRVAALTGISGFAELATVSSGAAVKLPDDVPFDFAAAFGVTYGTAYLALVWQAGVKPGDVVLVLGAAGGVGLAAIEIAKAKAATVIAAASSPEKLHVASEARADFVVDYTAQDLREAVLAVAADGVDIVFDPVGDRLAEPALRALRWQGRYPVIGFATGAIPKIPLNLVLLKSASAIGIFWGDWVARNPEANAGQVADILEMWRSGPIRARIGGRIKLRQVPAAIRGIIDRRAMGKLVVEIT